MATHQLIEGPCAGHSDSVCLVPLPPERALCVSLGFGFCKAHRERQTETERASQPTCVTIKLCLVREALYRFPGKFVASGPSFRAALMACNPYLYPIQQQRACLLQERLCIHVHICASLSWFWRGFNIRLFFFEFLWL